MQSSVTRACGPALVGGTPGAVTGWPRSRRAVVEARRFYILSGAIFPIYDKIMGSSGIHNVEIARAMLVDGRALVGLNLSPSDVPNVKTF